MKMAKKYKYSNNMKLEIIDERLLLNFMIVTMIMVVEYPQLLCFWDGCKYPWQ